MGNVHACALVQSAKEELGMATKLTSRIEQEEGMEVGVGMREVKESVSRCGKERMLERCQAKAPLVAEVAQRVSWAKVWDASMDLGINCMRGMQFGESDVSSWAWSQTLSAV